MLNPIQKSFGMSTKNALLSLSSGVNQKYIFQAIKITKLSDKITRLTLSDGNAYISADVAAFKLKQTISQYSLVKVELKYYGLGHPAEISTLEIVERSYKFILGKPIPFIDYINQGFISQEEEIIKPKVPEKTVVVDKPRYFRNDDEQPPRAINIEENQDEEPIFLVPQTSIDPYVPIDALEPKMNYWKILGRISWIDHKMIQVKAGLKSGQRVLVLNFFVIDKDAKEIKCSCFDEAANKFQYLLRKDGVYEFSNGKIFEQLQQTANRRFINIRFQVFSVITEIDKPMYSIPKHSYTLVRFDKLSEYNEQQQLDVAGIVKVILKKEDTNSTKLKMTLVLVDPVLRKQIDAVLYLQPQEALGVVQSNPFVLKNIKIVTAEEGTISLRSCFNSHYITQLDADEEIMKYLKPHLQKDFEKQNYESLSKINYKLRNLSEHLHSLELCENQQKIFSKVNCYFLGPFGQRKYYYQACVKCFKKVNSVNKKSNFCQKCKKIVEIRQQYLLKSQFVDWSKHIKLTLVGDYAKAILKIEAPQFVKLGLEEQINYMNSLRFTEVCLYLKSWKVKDNFNHNVQIIEKPHYEGFAKIQRILAGIKEE